MKLRFTSVDPCTIQIGTFVQIGHKQVWANDIEFDAGQNVYQLTDDEGNTHQLPNGEAVFVWRGAEAFIQWKLAHPDQNPEPQHQVVDGKIRVTWIFEGAGVEVLDGLMFVADMMSAGKIIWRDQEITEGSVTLTPYMLPDRPDYPDDGDGNPVPAPLIESGPLHPKHSDGVREALEITLPEASLESQDDCTYLRVPLTTSDPESYQHRLGYVRALLALCRPPVELEVTASDPSQIEGFLLATEKTQQWYLNPTDDADLYEFATSEFMKETPRMIQWLESDPEVQELSKEPGFFTEAARAVDWYVTLATTGEKKDLDVVALQSPHPELFKLTLRKLLEFEGFLP